MSCTSDELFAKAGLEWLAENTTIPVDLKDPEALTRLPARAQLFIRKFGELMQRSTGVTSQSIEGLSMSFDSSGHEAAIRSLANALLSGDLKTGVRVIPAKRRW